LKITVTRLRTAEHREIVHVLLRAREVGIGCGDLELTRVDEYRDTNVPDHHAG
jgi:hypothetical protein